jgi:hypothetical protein
LSKAAANGISVGYITASGHGGPDVFYGDNQQTIWDLHTLKASDVNDRIVHLTACHAGAQLGPEMINKGVMSHQILFLLICPRILLQKLALKWTLLLTAEWCESITRTQLILRLLIM